VSVIFIQVDQTGQPITPSWRFESTVYGNSLLFKENSASKKASKVTRSGWSESTLQRNLTLGDGDPRILQALASVGMNPGQLMAVAFRDLAGNAAKIGQLNVSPDLLREMLQPQASR
jgi:hypothetical protein